MHWKIREGVGGGRAGEVEGNEKLRRGMEERKRRKGREGDNRGEGEGGSEEGRNGE